jgi:hypothetical protein
MCSPSLAEFDETDAGPSAKALGRLGNLSSQPKEKKMTDLEKQSE